MPEDYKQGFIGKIELPSFNEFNMSNNKYRMSPLEDKEHEYLICIYDEESSFFKSYIPSIGIVKYGLPSEENIDEIMIIHLILSSAREKFRSELFR